MKRLFLILLTAVMAFSAVLPAAAREPIWPSVNKQNTVSTGQEVKTPSPGESLWAAGSTKKTENIESAVSTSVQTAAPVSGEEPIWTNLNSEAVKSGPEHYRVLTLKQDADPILIQRIRTYHWNGGKGAAPGTISVWEGETKLGSWQAVGRGGSGTPNIYWEVLVDIIMYPGHSYTFKVSDPDSMSYNQTSGNAGMFEIYGIDPAPEGYIASTWSNNSSPLASLKTGSTFRMGRYEQDNNINNGPESIEWQVLTVQGDRALVVSKYALDFKAYNDTITEITWENASLRKWLNNDFYNTAFNSTEKNQILLVTNENPDNPQFGIDGGNRTKDRIFVLSFEEAEKYFKNDQSRICEVTDYAAAAQAAAYASKGLSAPPSNGNAAWWLRTPGETSLKTVFVALDGSIYYYGYGAMVLFNGTAYTDVRPAFWVKLSAAPAPTPTPRSCYTVTYAGNDCLAKVPTDSKCYRLGDLVTLLFEPVEYMQGTIFNGWDMDDDGVADFGYYYNTFAMPGYDVELKAVCSRQYYDYSHSQYGLSDQYYDPHQYYNPYNDPTLNNDYYDPGTGWWYDSGPSYGYYYDGDG